MSRYYKQFTVPVLRNRNPPCWHLDIAHINWTAQPNGLTYSQKYAASAFHIYSAPWPALLKAMDKYFAPLYANQELWTDSQFEDTITDILKKWKKKIPLIPPQLAIMPGNPTKLYPVDGKHRLKTASVLDRKTAIFILFDVDLPFVSPNLPLTLIS